MVKTYTSYARKRVLHKTTYYANSILEIFLIFLAPCWPGFKFGFWMFTNEMSTNYKPKNIAVYFFAKSTNFLLENLLIS